MRLRIRRQDEVLGEVEWDGQQLTTTGLGDKLRYMALRGNTEEYLRYLSTAFEGDIVAELEDDPARPDAGSRKSL